MPPDHDTRAFLSMEQAVGLGGRGGRKKNWGMEFTTNLQVACKNKLQGTHTESLIALADDNREKKRATGGHIINKMYDTTETMGVI